MKSHHKDLVPWLLLFAASSCAKTKTEAAQEIPRVTVATVERADLAETLVLTGRVVPSPDRSTILAPGVEGVLSSVNGREGDRVRAGAILATVDPASLDGNVRQARAALERASSEARTKGAAATRSEALSRAGVVSRQDAEADRAAAVAAETALAESREVLAEAIRQRKRADLRAPFDAEVARVLRRTGETVSGSADTPVVELASPDSVEIALDAVPDVASRLAPGLAATVRRDRDTAEVRARVARVRSAVDADTGTQEVRLVLDADATPMPLGVGVSAEIEVRARHGVLVVPRRALRAATHDTAEVVVAEPSDQGGEPSVVARVREVKLGLRTADRVEASGEIREGQSVVVDDPTILTDGTPLRIAR